MLENIFDAGFYSASNPDLAAANLTTYSQLINHFRSYGAAEGRSASSVVDIEYYKQKNPDLVAARLNNVQLMEHLWSYGLAEDRNFSRFVDLDFYLSANSDLSRAFGWDRKAAFQHLNQYGISEKRLFSDSVDLKFYLSANPDVNAAFGGNGVGAMQHMIMFGLKEGRQVNPSFNVNEYRAMYPDLVAAGLNKAQSFNHYQDYGQREGRYGLESLRPGLSKNYWTRDIGLGWAARVDGSVTDSQGNFYVTGSEFNQTGNYEDWNYRSWFAKYDQIGNLLWQKYHDTPDEDFVSTVQVDATGAVYLGGTLVRNNVSQGWIAKYVNDGSTRLWYQELSGSDGFSVEDIELGSSGDLYVASTAKLFRYSGDGIKQWETAFDPVALPYGSSSTRAASLGVLSSGKIAVIGTSLKQENGKGFQSGWLGLYSAKGEKIWRQDLPSILGKDFITSDIDIDSQDNIYATGISAEADININSDSDIWLAKYSVNGSLIWGQKMGVKNYRDGIYDMELDSDENPILATNINGRFQVNSYSSSQGSSVWSREINGPRSSEGGPFPSGTAEISLSRDESLYVSTASSSGRDGRLTSAKYALNTPAQPYDSRYGYGLVDAAKAVAKSISQSNFQDVENIGGNNWSNDLIRSPEAWTRGYTGQGVVVAVIDTGIDITHPDLANNIWQNIREIAGNSIDDDRNGFVDDINGWNFYENSNNVKNGSTSVQGNAHGTHVAGTIAGLNNSFGVTGVAYNAKIMSIKLADVDSSTGFFKGGNLPAAIRYAVDNGAKVINMSLSRNTTYQALQDAIEYAHSRNVVVVSAAGNDGENRPDYPAAYAAQYGIAVGAVDRTKTLVKFSNRAGDNPAMKYVVAPGADVYSTLPGNNYANYSGTSMAAPHVAGVVALMLSANPNLTVEQVRQNLISSTMGIAYSDAIANFLPSFNF